MTKISRYLTQTLKLKVNREKSRVVKIENLNYLGFTFPGIRIFVCDQALQDFKHRLRGFTSRSWGVSMAERFERLNRYLRGMLLNRREKLTRVLLNEGNIFGVSQAQRK